MNRPKCKVNLFLIGAMKCGSTTLHEYLAEHPEIFMSQDKEPGFFVPEIWGKRDPSEYFNLFSAASNEHYLGESSTFYSKLPTFNGVARRIYSYNSEAKILYIVRNPLERIISHYFHHKRNLMLHAERRPILQAVQEDERYIVYTDYHKQIQPYIKFFGRQNVKVVKFESLLTDRDKVLSEIFFWLGINSSFVPSKAIKSNAKPREAEVVRGIGLLNKLRFSRTWGKISPLFPQLVKRVGNTLASKREKMELPSSEKEKLQKLLSPILNDICKRLEDTVNIDCSDWLIWP